MEYRTNEIRVEVLRDASTATYHAVYSIYRFDQRQLLCSGTIAGRVPNSSDVESEGYAAACRWIDRAGS